jgi:CRISPR-associated protein Csm4
VNVYAITIKPLSAFGTPIKGDTLFGHFCWQAVHDDSLLKGGFEKWISKYEESPFAIFSSAFPVVKGQDGKELVCFPSPSIPHKWPDDMPRDERIRQRKQIKKKKWILVPADELGNGVDTGKMCDDAEVFNMHLQSLPDELRRKLQFLPDNQKKPFIYFVQAHNSINRLTMTTGKGFDPYSMENCHFMPQARLVIFAAIEPDALEKDGLKKGMSRIGLTGFGRDASTGLGRFEVTNIKRVEWPGPDKGDGCYTLAPCVPAEGEFDEQFAMPFTRFGRHGAELVLSRNPFKNPVVMADEGAVFFASQKRPVKIYVGTALSGLSLVEEKTVAQGYTLYLPVSRRSL